MVEISFFSVVRKASSLCGPAVSEGFTPEQADRVMTTAARTRGSAAFLKIRMKSLSTRSFEYNYSAHVKILLFNRDKQDKRDNIKIKSLLNLSQKVSNLLEFKSLYP